MLTTGQHADDQKFKKFAIGEFYCGMILLQNEFAHTSALVQISDDCCHGKHQLPSRAATGSLQDAQPCLVPVGPTTPECFDHWTDLDR
jgi:hypothetical protein